MTKSFFISGASVLMIKDDGANIVWLKVTDDGEGMQEVTAKEFIDYFKGLAYVCITSWNSDLVKEYREFNKAIQEAVAKEIEYRGI